MALSIVTVDYKDPVQGRDLLHMLECYARDPMGGGEALASHTHQNLLAGLAAHPTAFSLLAYIDEEPVGLANCFFGFSTFAAAPLVNIHDMVVKSGYRGQGIAKALFEKIEQIAAERGACKLTLEVLSGNRAAQSLYRSIGFGDYGLDPQKGTALFWEKKLAL